MRRGVRAAGGALVAVLALTLAGCTSDRPAPGGSTTTRTETRTIGSSPPATTAFTPVAPSSRAPLRPGAKPHRGERAGACPYIKAGPNLTSGSGPNVADIEGDRVGRTTVLSALRPVGCRFYFAGSGYEGVGYEATAEIHPQTLSDATTARNAMILTARTGTEVLVERDFVKGLDGISFRTRFFGPDKARDWAFVFAKGRVLVTVYTQRTDTSRNAVYLAQAIAGKF